jgi:hypothetical protein
MGVIRHVRRLGRYLRNLDDKKGALGFMDLKGRCCGKPVGMAGNGGGAISRYFPGSTSTTEFHLHSLVPFLHRLHRTTKVP